MLGCAGGQWVMGTAHNNPSLPSTVVRTTAHQSRVSIMMSSGDCQQAFGVFSAHVYNESAALKRSLGDRASTAAEVRFAQPSLVRL